MGDWRGRLQSNDEWKIQNKIKAASNLKKMICRKMLMSGEK
jgi:hypothetical protein